MNYKYPQIKILSNELSVLNQIQLRQDQTTEVKSAAINQSGDCIMVLYDSNSIQFLRSSDFTKEGNKIESFTLQNSQIISGVGFLG